jgi:hypothetical protein
MGTARVLSTERLEHGPERTHGPPELPWRLVLDLVCCLASRNRPVVPRGGRLFSRRSLGRLNCLLFSVWYFWPNVEKLVSPPMPALAASSRSTPRCCRAIPTTDIRSTASLTPPRSSPVAQSSAPMSTRAIAATTPQSASRLHLRPEARGLWPHQTRVASPLCHRGRDRAHENGRPSRPPLSQRPQGQCRQRHSLRCRLQPPPRPRLAEDSVEPNPAHSLSGVAVQLVLTMAS